MPEDYESRLEQILAELRPGKRNILQDHINELSGKEREDFIKEVIKEYDAAKKAASEKASGEAEKPGPPLSYRNLIRRPKSKTNPEKTNLPAKLPTSRAASLTR